MTNDYRERLCQLANLDPVRTTLTYVKPGIVHHTRMMPYGPELMDQELRIENLGVSEDGEWMLTTRNAYGLSVSAGHQQENQTIVFSTLYDVHSNDYYVPRSPEGFAGVVTHDRKIILVPVNETSDRTEPSTTGLTSGALYTGSELKQTGRIERIGFSTNENDPDSLAVIVDGKLYLGWVEADHRALVELMVESESWTEDEAFLTTVTTSGDPQIETFLLENPENFAAAAGPEDLSPYSNEPQAISIVRIDGGSLTTLR